MHRLNDIKTLVKRVYNVKTLLKDASKHVYTYKDDFIDTLS
jgi:hypothetical protein